MLIIAHVHSQLLLTLNESLCAHQLVETMNATLFSCAGYLAGKQSVTLCLLSTAARTDTGERPSLLAAPTPADTPPPLRLYVCSTPTHMCSHEAGLTRGFIPIMWPHSQTDLCGNIKCSSMWCTLTHSRTHTEKLSLHWHLTPGIALDPQWQQAGGTATHSYIRSLAGR